MGETVLVNPSASASLAMTNQSAADIPAPVLLSDSAAMLAWFRGEFAAANAIIDALCGHIMEGSGSEEYSAVMVAIHRRRMNWIPVLQMQKYHSISQVTLELRAAKTSLLLHKQQNALLDDDSPTSDITEEGVVDEEESCEPPPPSLLIKHPSERFSAKEHVRGHTASPSITSHPERVDT